jgi:HAD superfamily hydrolase (TIGR01509 family)
LVDSESLGIRIDQRILSEIGIEMSLEEIVDEYVGKSDEHFFSDVAMKFGSELPADFRSRFHEQYEQVFASELRSVDGIREFLDESDMPNCVASSGSIAKIERSLELTNLHKYFAGRIFSGEQVPRGKPFPDLFLFAAQRMGFAPSDCIVVEDSVPGVTAGLAAGMKVIAFAGSVTARVAFEPFDVLVIDHMSQLVDVI